MKEAKYIRSGRVIKNTETGEKKEFPSITLAKRESRNIQMTADGALGRGTVRVEK